MEPFTTVVSGFPRTGTSTMMRMLSLGGLSPIADERFMESQNKFDAYGAVEKENVAKAMVDMGPDETNGKVVKIVTPHITWLPLDRPLKVVFMLRDLTEVVASLLTMQTIWEVSPDESVAHARRFIEEYALDVHYVQYHEMVKYPRSTAIGVNEFLGLDLDIDKMATAVDPKARGKGKDTGVRDWPDLITYGFKEMAVEYYNTRKFLSVKEEA